MRKSALFAAGLISVLSLRAVEAQPVGGVALREAIAGLPAAAASNPVPVQALFLDLSVLLSLGPVDGPDGVLGRIGPTAEMAPIRTLAGNSREHWEKDSGIPLAALRSLTAMDDLAVVWRTRDVAVAEAAMAHLVATGFARQREDVVADPGPFMVMERMSNPWRALRASPSQVRREGATLEQAAPAIGALLAAVPPGGGAADTPGPRVALAGLESRLGGGQVVQAVLFSPLLTMRAGDPAELMRAPPGTARPPAAEPAGGGLPPYRQGVLADVTEAGRPAVAIGLAYPDCATAEAAVARLRAGREGWGAPGAAPPGLSAAAVPAEGGCAAALRVDGTPAGTANPVLSRLWVAIMRREPTPLDIR